MLIILVSTIAGAVGVDMVLVSPKGTVQGGTAVVLDLYLHNNTAATVVRELPLSVPCRIHMDQKSVSVTAELVDGQSQSRVEINAHGFAKRQYTVSLPVYATGSVRLLLETLDTPLITVQVDAAPPEAWVGQQIPLDQGFTMAQSYLDNLSIHEPIYFLLGVDPGLEKSKFQFSFRYRLFNPEGFMAEFAPWMSGFHLGYTQRSLWDLKDDSRPFEDTSYMPEIFYLFPHVDLNVTAITAFGIQTGCQHESNGKGGDDSRSTNYLYIKPIMGMSLAGPFHLKIAPRLFTYVDNSEDTNDDLEAYRGYVDFEIGIVDPEGLGLNSHLWWARKGATVQLDLTYPMTRLFGKNLNFYLLAQYFSGYAETLLNYNQRHDAFRLGVSIVR